MWQASQKRRLSHLIALSNLIQEVGRNRATDGTSRYRYQMAANLVIQNTSPIIFLHWCSTSQQFLRLKMQLFANYPKINPPTLRSSLLLLVFHVFFHLDTSRQTKNILSKASKIIQFQQKSTIQLIFCLKECDSQRKYGDQVELYFGGIPSFFNNNYNILNFSYYNRARQQLRPQIIKPGQSCASFDINWRKQNQLLPIFMIISSLYSQLRHRLYQGKTAKSPTRTQPLHPRSDTAVLSSHSRPSPRPVPSHQSATRSPPKSRYPKIFSNERLLSQLTAKEAWGEASIMKNGSFNNLLPASLKKKMGLNSLIFLLNLVQIKKDSGLSWNSGLESGLRAFWRDLECFWSMLRLEQNGKSKQERFKLQLKLKIELLGDYNIFEN